jgi:hypothetical protein
MCYCNPVSDWRCFRHSPNFATENFTDVSLAASTAGSVQVIVDPHAEYEVDVSNGPLLVADVGLKR